MLRLRSLASKLLLIRVERRLSKKVVSLGLSGFSMRENLRKMFQWEKRKLNSQSRHVRTKKVRERRKLFSKADLLLLKS